jgi:adenylate cyclase
MPAWTRTYYEQLIERFEAITLNLDERLDDVVEGRVAPAIDDLSIGTARKLEAAILVFDIRGFTDRLADDDDETIRDALHMLDCVIPMLMHLVHDHAGYVEKNTGDGLLAVFAAVGGNNTAAVEAALNTAGIGFYLLRNLVNPYLYGQGIDPVDARIGIDFGKTLIARLGVPRGTAKHDRSFLTVVGATPNIATRIQGLAGTNQIWIGDLAYRLAAQWRHDKNLFRDVTPYDWKWQYRQSLDAYRVWRYTGVRNAPS